MKVKGIIASEGIAIAKVFKFKEVKLDIPDKKTDDTAKEIAKLDAAIKVSVEELKTLKKQTLNAFDEEHAMVFDAHIEIANDPEIKRQVEALITNQSFNAAKAFKEVTDDYEKLFKAMDDNYLKERHADVKDVARRIISHLIDVDIMDPSNINEEVIVVADDLSPSDTAQLNKQFVQGFVTNIGGRTSHSAIMARSLELPAVVGTGDIMDNVSNDDTLIIDGEAGIVIINPTKDEINTYKEKQKTFKQRQKQLEKYKNKPSVTQDGTHVEIAANINNPSDMEMVIDNGADGVGLFRTEYLYMDKKQLPTEDIQFNAYKKVLEHVKDQKVIIRTLDIGADKSLDYLPLVDELNPFLGQRSLRLCLEEQDMFKTQLRALLRASVYGDLHVMFPMVATLDELREAKRLLEECRQELKAEQVDYDEITLGIMVEIPAVAMLADKFAKEVEFFSIGTNDLIQYTFAADRMNQKVAYLYQPYNPALLRLIKSVIDAAHKADIWVGMCGEMASDQLAAPILLGLGLDEFSMSVTSILKTRRLFSQLSFAKMKQFANECLDLETHNQVKKHIEDRLK
ncbi:MAG: phosphoenolpyruvate--protein phosphotransferase [Candidatus Izimaplasma sp.]|nr:phosphoenolpyruvate--protein phosphotransferase [Candidatus Izimaplasma bacterium]